MASGYDMPMPKVFSYSFIALLVGLTAAVIGYQMWSTSPTMPVEGFAGPIHLGGQPDCIQSSHEAAELYSVFTTKASTTEEGEDDLREFRVLLGKIACLKRDLMSAGHLISATKNQPFSTSQDLEPVAETAARCFALTIPARDIDIAVDKWKTRGTMLVKRLCTSFSFTGAQQKESMDLFNSVMADIYDVMQKSCLKGDSSIAGMPTPRMVEGREPSENMNLGEYKGYY
jgi:hypothetical protein